MWLAMSVAIGWIIFGVILYVVWRLTRALRRGYRQMAQQRAEAFSNAVSAAVASGVATAISAAVADSTAAATGGHVAVHIGDNVARLLADNDHNALYGNDDSNAVRERMGIVSNTARHGELASGRPFRARNTDNPNRGSIRSVTVESGEIA